MKTFTATQLNKAPQEIFKEAERNGSAVIAHDRYTDGVFAIVWQPDQTFDHEFEGEYKIDPLKFSVKEDDYSFVAEGKKILDERG